MITMTILMTMIITTIITTTMTMTLIITIITLQVIIMANYFFPVKDIKTKIRRIKMERMKIILKITKLIKNMTRQ